jgi:uncharacterized protein
MSKIITFEDIKNDTEVQAYLKAADDNFAAVGYKEHGLRHAELGGNIAGNVLKYLGYPERTIELAKIAGYLHDIGNSINQVDHAQTGAILAYDILEKLGLPISEIFSIICAIDNHEDKDIIPPTEIVAAVILADKTDVHHSRVRSNDISKLDTHGRVNYACQRAFLRVTQESRVISLELNIDTKVCPVMDYFEIFMARIKFCITASKALDCEFHLFINNDKFL